MISLQHDPDLALVKRRIASWPDSRSVAEFVPGPGIERLALSFDIRALRKALAECLRRSDFMGDMQDDGFAALPLTQRSGQMEWTENDLSGRYWLRGDDRCVEEAREDLVPKKAFSEFNPIFCRHVFRGGTPAAGRPFSDRLDEVTLQGALQLQQQASRP